MKTNSLVKISRNGKDIIIYVNDGNWNSIPNLDFIADIEIYEQPEPPKDE